MKTKKVELIFILYFIVMFGARAVGLYEGMTIYNISLIIGAGLFGVKILSTRHTILEYLIIFLFMLLGSVVYINTGEKGLIMYFSLMLGMKYISTKRVFRTGLFILSIAFSVLVTLSLSGLINDISYINKRSGFGYLLRHSLGYPYPNTLHTTLLILVILIMYLYNADTIKKLIISSALMMVINIYIYCYSISLTGLISITAYLVINFYLQVRKMHYGTKGLCKLERVLITIYYPAIVLFSILGPILATGDAFTFMNKLLHNRYKYALYYLENEPITLLGKRFAPAPTNWYMIDNSFLYLFLQLGIIPFVIVTIMYLYMIHKLVKENKMSELAIMLTFCLIGMSDPFLFNLSFKNLTFIFIGYYLYKWTGSVINELPERFKFLQKEILILKFGDDEITLKKTPYDIYINILTALKNEFLSHTVLYLLIFVVFTGGVSFIYYETVSQPQTMYIDADTNDPYDKDNYMYLDEETAEAIQNDGNIIFGYNNEDEPMYYYEGTAPAVEYARNVASTGIGAGTAATFVLMILDIMKKRRNNSNRSF